MLASVGMVDSVARAEQERPTPAGALVSEPLPRLLHETHRVIDRGRERLWAPPRLSSFRNRLMSSDTSSGDTGTQSRLKGHLVALKALVSSCG